jgi:hypothetical protein
MMTLNERIGSVIDGHHVMGQDGLGDYHTVQRVKKAMRKHQPSMRYVAIKQALKNYRVIVTQTPEPVRKVRVFCPATQAEVVL